jgi:Bacteroides conjugative transposon TraK protein
MFQQLSNIDSAFKHVRIFTLVIIVACITITCFSIYKGYSFSQHLKQQVIILPDGKAIIGLTSSRKDNIPVETRRHVKDFHSAFFTLSPDDKAISETMKRAMYLADQSAKRVYDDLKENGYFSQLISSNTSQQVLIDSVTVQTNSYPYYFRFFGKLRIVRPLTVTTRNLITEGFLRDLQIRTDNNPNGFLIEKWTIVDNKDLEVQKR